MLCISSEAEYWAKVDNGTAGAIWKRVKDPIACRCLCVSVLAMHVVGASFVGDIFDGVRLVVCRAWLIYLKRREA